MTYKVDIEYSGAVTLYVDADNSTEAMGTARKQFSEFNEVDELGVDNFTITDVREVK